MRENSGGNGGIDEPYWGPYGKRRQEVGWGKDAPCLRLRRPTRTTSTPRRRIDVVGGSSERNMKISAVRSLADICFLHVLFGILIVLFN